MDAQAISEALVDETAVASGLSYAEFQKQFDGRHAEWLCGEVILIVNNVEHNRILLFLGQLLGLYLGFKPLGELLLSGVSMYVGDDKPAREPDLMVILNENRDRIQKTQLDGAADIAVEIVSPESRHCDYVLKYEEFQTVGVREYWLIDPEREQADIYVLGSGDKYRRAALDGQGRLISSVLPNFALEPAILWRETLPVGAELIELVNAMVR